MGRAMTLAALAAATAVLCGCAGDDDDVPAVEEVAGECADAYGARICTWARTQGGDVIEIGATVPLASLENAPEMVEMTWPPAAAAAPLLPAGVHGDLTHMTMYWEPMGHAPQTFMIPHFDFHFYFIPPEERMAIDCSDVTKPDVLPAAYTLPDETLPPDIAAMIGVETLVGVCVPQMGMHSLVEAELASPEPFRGTMVIGYYRGQPIFVEPMISQAMLLERQSFELPIPAIPGVDGGQPTQFRADYDATQDAYRFTFTGFKAST